MLVVGGTPPERGLTLTYLTHPHTCPYKPSAPGPTPPPSPAIRIYDITNVLEGIGLIEKKSKNNIQVARHARPAAPPVPRPPPFPPAECRR